MDVNFDEDSGQERTNEISKNSGTEVAEVLNYVAAKMCHVEANNEQRICNIYRIKQNNKDNVEK